MGELPEAIVKSSQVVAVPATDPKLRAARATLRPRSEAHPDSQKVRGSQPKTRRFQGDKRVNIAWPDGSHETFGFT